MTLEELDHLSKDELIALVLKLAKRTAELAERIAQLDNERDNRNPPKANGAPKWVKARVPEPEEKQPRAEERPPDSWGKHRPHGFARKREEPTHRTKGANKKP